MSLVDRRMASFLAALLLFVMAVIAPWMLLSMSFDQDHSGCPFMQGQMSLCSMNVFDHIEHWQSAFTLVLIEILSFITFMAAFGFAWLIPRLRERSPPHNRSAAPPTLFQELFAQGLLNSKAF